MANIFRSDDGAYRIPEPISSTSSDRKINTSAKIYFRRRFINCVIILLSVQVESDQKDGYDFYILV